MDEEEDQANLFDIAFAFGYGFLNNTFGTSSPNSTVCRGNVTIFLDSVNVIRDEIE